MSGLFVGMVLGLQGYDTLNFFMENCMDARKLAARDVDDGGSERGHG